MQAHNLHPISLTCPDRNRTNWENILSVFSNHDIKCTSLISQNEGFKALFPNIDEADKVFDETVLNQLDNLRCTPTKPYYLKSSRTIIVKNADMFLMDHCNTEIMDNINASNMNDLKVTDVYKFPSGRTMKFECITACMARNVLENGFRCFNLVINSLNLSLEESIQAKFCYKCYAINDHTSKHCPKPDSYKCCSTCSARTHTHKECKSNIKKCLNCNGEHLTMAKSCPIYKEAIANIKKTTMTGKLPASSTSPTHSVNSSNKEVNSQIPPQNNFLQRDDMFRGFMSLMYASSLENDMPNSFEENLKALLSANNLPAFSTANLPAPRFMNVAKNNGASQLRGQGLYSEIPKQSSSVPICRGDVPPSSANGNTNVPSTISFAAAAASVPSTPADLDASTARSTRSKNPNPTCVIYVKKKFVFGKGNIFAHIIAAKNAVVEHQCSDTVKCLQVLGKKVSAGDVTHLKVKELSILKFEEKLEILGGN